MSKNDELAESLTDRLFDLIGSVISKKMDQVLAEMESGVKEKLNKLKTQNKELIKENEFLNTAIKEAGAYMAMHPRDWSGNRRDAALWSLICGWDEASIRELKNRFNWESDSVPVKLNRENIGDDKKYLSIPKFLRKTLEVPAKNGVPTTSNVMKKVHIGEYKFYIPDSDEEGCEISREVTVPWDLCKEIYKNMAVTAAKGYDNE